MALQCILTLYIIPLPWMACDITKSDKHIELVKLSSQHTFTLLYRYYLHYKLFVFVKYDVHYEMFTAVCCQNNKLTKKTNHGDKFLFQQSRRHHNSKSHTGWCKKWITAFSVKCVEQLQSHTNTNRTAVTYVIHMLDIRLSIRSISSLSKSLKGWLRSDWLVTL